MSKRTSQLAADVIVYDREWLSANPSAAGEWRPRLQGEFGTFEREADDLDVQVVFLVEYEGEHFRIGQGRGLMMVAARLDACGNPIVRLLSATPGTSGFRRFALRCLTSQEMRSRGLRESTALVRLEYWEPETGADGQKRNTRQGLRGGQRHAAGEESDES